MAGYMKPRPLPRIEVFFPLVSEENRQETLLHECAHIAYKDMRISEITESEAAAMMWDIAPEIMETYPPHQAGEEAVIRLVDMRRGGAKIFGISRQLASAVGRLSRPRPFRAALWASVPIVMCAALVLAGSPAGAWTFSMPTGSPLNQPHMSEHVYELDGECLRAVPRTTAAPSSIESPDMAAFMSALSSRPEWSVSSVSCATYRALHDAGEWGTGVEEQTAAGVNNGIIYYPWHPY